ncbi:YfhO family protein [Flavihumibacter petaseus]|uniref:Membrane protein YfhO n=1 Tax=Flavihumibacter petaseus NBRC 106054 TaxID=1220578 RepID=A0A0E9N113_9BACT|nr:YfhO family protein [Flavihumibacter petaseus]GAO43712.1 hypothetical protein FPE01S_02_08180 [Flavihumibacter petaseus NBRC 106054]
MKSTWFRQLLPHLLAMLLFLVIAAIYCHPALQGKVLDQHDIDGWKGMAQQSFEFREKHGHFPLWTNSLFSGMPAYTVAYEGPVLQTIYFQTLLTLGLPVPVSFFFLACICFYFLCIVFRINPWIGAATAVGYAYATFDPIIIAVGHNTQMMAIAYAPAVIGSLALIYQRKFWLGAALFALFFGLQISTQHIQIVYYTCIMMGLMSVAYAIHEFRNKQVKTLVPAFGIALVAALLGLGTYAVTWMPLKEYSKATMRGGTSELTPTDSTVKSTGGLDKDYAFYYGSYGIAESFSVIQPGIYGGGSMSKSLKAGNSAFASKLAEVGMPEENAVAYANGYTYWGGQPGHAGPVYLGAIICFLFIYGLVVVKSWHKWWMVAAVVFAFLLSWGKNLASLNYFLFDVLPLYNKFRAPSMSLVIPQLVFPLLGAMGLQHLLSSAETADAKWKSFKTALYATGGVFALLLFFYFTADFSGPNDAALRDQFTGMMLQGAQGQQNPQMQQQAASFSQSLISALKEDRQSIFFGGFIRSLLLIALAGGLCFAYIRGKIKPVVLLAGILVLTMFDLLGIASRYLGTDNYLDKENADAVFAPNAADLEILKDTQKPFRVFDQTDPQGPFNGSRASYFHDNVGGYSPAKLSLYDDLIKRQLSKGNMQVFNMLNTRYFITQSPQTGQAYAQKNESAFGPAWFVKSVKTVRNADEEMAALDSTYLRETAVVQQKFAALAGTPAYDSAATIQWIENGNDKIRYKTHAAGNQFAVFSEIYYDKGWNAYLDSKQVPYTKVNYALRGMPVPAGDHEIEFRFEPTSVTTSRLITIVSTLIVLLLLALAAWQSWKNRPVQSSL